MFCKEAPQMLFQLIPDIYISKLTQASIVFEII